MKTLEELRADYLQLYQHLRTLEHNKEYYALSIELLPFPRAVMINMLTTQILLCKSRIKILKDLIKEIQGNQLMALK